MDVFKPEDEHLKAVKLGSKIIAVDFQAGNP